MYVEFMNTQRENEKTAMEYMNLCMEYDMSFSYDIERGVMYIDYSALGSENYAEVFFDTRSWEMEKACICVNEEILEFTSKDYFYEILESLRKDNLERLYQFHGLVEHSKNRYKRRGDYTDTRRIMETIREKTCMIDYEGNLVCIQSDQQEASRGKIFIAVKRGQFQFGMLRRNGITNDILSIESMVAILEHF